MDLIKTHFMTFLSNIIQTIQPSPTLALTAKANALKAEGKDILNFAGGEPDFPTPSWICERATQAMDEGKTRYTPASGTTSLKKAVIEKFKRENNLIYDMNEVTIGNGAKQLIYNAFMVSLNPHDEVIIPAPYWVSYPDMVRLAGGMPVIVDCLENDHFLLSPESLEKAITPQTKWVILNSPSNPTGSVYGKEHLKALSDVLEKYSHVHVMSDDIYEHLIYDGCAFFTLPMVAPHLKKRTLVINGVSKAYAMTGWRIGYACGDEELIKAMNILQSQSTSNACSIAQEAAEEALNGPQDFLNDWRASYTRRRDMLVHGINTISGLSIVNPKGAFYGYMNVSELIGQVTPQGVTLEDDNSVAEYFIEAAGVVGVPGSAFGLAPYVRLSYAVSDAIIKDGLKRIEKAVMALSKHE
jgi:aspartate aminotransferase